MDGWTDRRADGKGDIQKWVAHSKTEIPLLLKVNLPKTCYILENAIITSIHSHMQFLVLPPMSYPFLLSYLYHYFLSKIVYQISHFAELLLHYFELFTELCLKPPKLYLFFVIYL